MDYSGTIKITDEATNEILHISSTSPREIGLKFSTWSLRSIAGNSIIKDGINHTAKSSTIIWGEIPPNSHHRLTQFLDIIV